MADTISSSKNLTVGLEYIDPIDGATKTTNITIPKYKSSITEIEIKQAFNHGTFYVGQDSEGNQSVITSENVVTASTTNQTINNIDIGWED